MQNMIINITGTHCPACKKLIEKRIMTVTGVTSVNVDYITGETKIMANNEISKSEISKVLEGTDYGQKN